MKVKLERFVNNGWYEYCTYDLAKESDNIQLIGSKGTEQKEPTGEVENIPF